MQNWFLTLQLIILILSPTYSIPVGRPIDPQATEPTVGQNGIASLESLRSVLMKGTASEDYIVHGPGENEGEGFYITEFEPIPGNKVNESLPNASNQGPEFVESNSNNNDNKESVQIK